MLIKEMLEMLLTYVRHSYCFLLEDSMIFSTLTFYSPINYNRIYTTLDAEIAC